jgi:hypothetical protein
MQAVSVVSSSVCMPSARLSVGRQQGVPASNTAVARPRRQTARRPAARRVVLASAEASSSPATQQLKPFAETVPQRVLGGDGKLAEVRCFAAA